jgi:hypothetical protein
VSKQHTHGFIGYFILFKRIYKQNIFTSGYALTVAKLWMGELVISGAPNWNQPGNTGHFGKVTKQMFLFICM